MNREIKFRAWDKEKNVFVPQGEIVFSDYGDTSISVIPNDISYIGDECHNGEPQRGRFIITQYTGLKDKNGVEIYEGDKIIDSNGEKQVVSYREDMARFVCRFPCGASTDIDCNCEVIGNIYEKI